MENNTAEKLVPAVVIRGEVNGLGVVRSLAKANVPTIVVDTTLRHAAMWSRHGRRHLVAQLSGRPLVDSLLRLQATLGVKPVLLLTDETAVHSVSEYRDELIPYYHIQLPTPAMVARLGNKAAFANFAALHDLPVPRTLVLEREADIAKIPELGMPVIAKPADKRLVHLGQVERINWLNTFDDAAVACRRMLGSAGTLVVQEWIEGPDSSIYFALFHCGKNATPRTVFFGRKIAAHPPGLGSTAVCVPAAEATELLQPLTDRFLDVSQYEGLGSLEFKWDSRARRFVIIEPTVGRTDWQEEIATLNGVNLALVAYCHELGLPVPVQHSGNAAAWRVSILHFGRSAALRERVYDGYWRIDDPLPGLAFGIEFAARSMRRLFAQRLFERRKPPFRQRRIASG